MSILLQLYERKRCKIKYRSEIIFITAKTAMAHLCKIYFSEYNGSKEIHLFETTEKFSAKVYLCVTLFLVSRLQAK